MLIADIFFKLRTTFRNDHTDIEGSRRSLEKIAGLIPNLYCNILRKEVQFEKFDAEWLLPKGATHHVILYLHGGGYISGSHRTHRSMVSKICESGNFNALVVNYRLAPENPYPAALEDALEAYDFLLKEGYSNDQIIVAGDSAGGGLSMALMYHLRDHQQKLPKAAVLICPWTDLKMSGKSIDINIKDPFLTRKTLEFMAQNYTQGQDRNISYISPFYGDITELPSIYIQAGATDPLVDDAVRLHDKIIAAGGKSRLDVYPGMFHVWQAFYIFLGEGKKALKDIASFARTEFDK